VTAFRAVVLEHFRHPHNRGALADATHEAEGANPLCGDRIRVQLKLNDGRVEAARFTADACAICIAAASVLTDAARGRALEDVAAIDLAWLHDAMEGEPPAGRKKCVALPLDTLQRAMNHGGRR
jgi:nitrogen fixation NifU-like protein